MAPVIRIQNFTKVYGSVVAVSGLNLEIEPGEVFGLLGPNGAGKTTTMLTLAGLVRPTSGNVSLFGKDLTRNWTAVAPRIGVAVDRPAFYSHLTARQNLAVLARLARRDVNFDRALDRAGLLRQGDTRVRRLSRGQRQRLALAQALMTEPEILILDEPTTGLDAEASLEILQLLHNLAHGTGLTIVFSSHLLREVETLCTRVAILNDGRLLACEHTDNLLSFDQTHVEVLIDAPEAAAKRLAAEPWVDHAECRGERLQVALSTGTVHQLIAFLMGAGYRISGVIPRRRTLQDYFLKVLNR